MSEDDEFVCAICNQRGEELQDRHGVFGRPAIFGLKDDWAFHAQDGGGYLCGSCMLDSCSMEQLNEYGIERVKLGPYEKGYRTREKPTPTEILSYQDIPPAFRTAKFDGLPQGARDKIRKWYTGQQTQLLLLGDAMETSWAIFRKVKHDRKKALWVACEDLMRKIRFDENGQGDGRPGHTVKQMKAHGGTLIVHDAGGLTQSQSKWLGSILDERHAHRRRTVVTILETDTLPTAVVARSKYGVVAAVDEWGAGMIGG